MPIGPMVVNYGNVSDTFVLSVTLAPQSVGATTAAEQTFTVPGLQVGDQISDVSLQAAWTVAVATTNYRTSAANTLAVSYYNSTAGALSPPTGTYYIEVNRPVAGQIYSGIQ